MKPGSEPEAPPGRALVTWVSGAARQPASTRHVRARAARGRVCRMAGQLLSCGGRVWRPGRRRMPPHPPSPGLCHGPEKRRLAPAARGGEQTWCPPCRRRPKPHRGPAGRRRGKPRPALPPGRGGPHGERLRQRPGRTAQPGAAGQGAGQQGRATKRRKALANPQKTGSEQPDRPYFPDRCPHLSIARDLDAGNFSRFRGEGGGGDQIYPTRSRNVAEDCRNSGRREQFT
jgi:hypothetical protein